MCGPRREAEERAGAALVGVTDVEFLRWPDGTVTGGIELRRAIAGVVRRRRPEMVLTMTFETGAGGSVNHADHRAVGLATIDAVRDAANCWVFPELGAAWSGVQATYAFGASEPTHFVDVSDTMDAAVQSLGAHRAYLDGLGGEMLAVAGGTVRLGLVVVIRCIVGEVERRRVRGEAAVVTGSQRMPVALGARPHA